MQKPLLIVIAGPTAVGKTAVAIRLAQLLQTEIISADSRQCYQGMAIGTAQPNRAELAAVMHHFVASYSPEVSLNAADFERLSLGYLENIFAQKQTAIVCGGTGLYIKALCAGLDDMPAVDVQINATVLQDYEMLGVDWLREAIRQEDPLFYAQAATDNPARMLRALAFVRSVGKSILLFQIGQSKERPFRILKIGLELPRVVLYDRINQRVDLMMQEGLLDEVRALYPLHKLKNLNTVGYAELFAYLSGTTSLADAVDKIKQHSRNYAKRQLTWFKKDPAFHWFLADDAQLIDQIIALINR
jgi:tRNA dimethylallyltransferase